MPNILTACLPRDEAIDLVLDGDFDTIRSVLETDGETYEQTYSKLGFSREFSGYPETVMIEMVYGNQVATIKSVTANGALVEPRPYFEVTDEPEVTMADGRFERVFDDYSGQYFPRTCQGFMDFYELMKVCNVANTLDCYVKFRISKPDDTPADYSRYDYCIVSMEDLHGFMDYGNPDAEVDWDIDSHGDIVLYATGTPRHV